MVKIAYIVLGQHTRHSLYSNQMTKAVLYNYQIPLIVMINNVNTKGMHLMNEYYEGPQKMSSSCFVAVVNLLLQGCQFGSS